MALTSYTKEHPKHQFWTKHRLVAYRFFHSTISFFISIIAAYMQITHMEMIKGIQGHGYYDELVVPIIENTAQERELTESLAAAVCFSMIWQLSNKRFNSTLSFDVWKL